MILEVHNNKGHCWVLLQGSVDYLAGILATLPKDCASQTVALITEGIRIYTKEVVKKEKVEEDEVVETKPH